MSLTAIQRSFAAQGSSQREKEPLSPCGHWWTNKHNNSSTACAAHMSAYIANAHRVLRSVRVQTATLE